MVRESVGSFASRLRKKRCTRYRGELAEKSSCARWSVAPLPNIPKNSRNRCKLSPGGPNRESYHQDKIAVQVLLHHDGARSAGFLAGGQCCLNLGDDLF